MGIANIDDCIALPQELELSACENLSTWTTVIDYSSPGSEYSRTERGAKDNEGPNY